MHHRLSEVNHLLRSCRASKLPAPRLDGLAGPSVDDRALIPALGAWWRSVRSTRVEWTYCGSVKERWVSSARPTALRGMRGGIKGSVMPRLVLFIETVSSPLREECAGAVHFVSEHIQWSSLVLERLREHRADLVVAVAAPRCSHAANFFRWLVKNPIGAPTLAVLPPDNDLIQLAAQAVD